MPVRTEPTQPEVHDSPYNTEDFSEPSPPTQSADALDDETDDSEIQKLRDALEHQARSFHDQLQQRAVQLKEIEATIIAASKKLESQQQSNRVMKEYEKSIATLENEIDRVKRQIAKTSQDRVKIAEERDLAADDLRRAELAFSDLHSKYEKAKQIVSNFKKNEEILMNRYDVMKLKLEHRDAKLKYLQDSVEDVFQRMKMDYESRIKSEDSEGNRIRAQLRKLELRMSTIEKDLEQKEKENSQLSLLCDDLIKGQRN
jgi:chromosome segregation ATPase